MKKPQTAKLSAMQRIDLVMAELNPLADAGRLNFTEENYAPRPAPETIAAIERLHGPLPPGLREIYDCTGSIHIEWEVPRKLPNGDSSPIRGSINVPTIERMFGDWKESLWLDSSPPDAIGRSLRPLDKFTAEWWAVMRPGDPLVYLLEAGIDDSLRRTGLTVEDWFERTLEARFYDGWLFCCAEKPHPQHAKDMARDLTGLFAPIDFSRFRAAAPARRAKPPPRRPAP